MKNTDEEEELDLSAGMVPHHNLGPVTGYDHDSGLPIVKRANTAEVPAQKQANTDEVAQSKPAYDVGPLAGKPIPGMQQIGNIDVNHRPSILNEDGSHSSIYSMTIPVDKDGSPWNGDFDKAPQYALVPSIANGKFLTPNGKIPAEGDKAANSALEDRAADYYDKTRQHLGIFSSADAADQYATKTHAYSNDGTGKQVYAPSYEGDTNLPAGATDALPGIPPAPIPAALQPAGGPN
jgi:hypothetical protein